jgi:hypothetical protein
MSNMDEMRMDKSHISVASLYDESDEIDYWQKEVWREDEAAELR